MDKILTREEIKEALRSQMPWADFQWITSDGISYITFIKLPYAESEKKYPVYFHVRLKDISDRVYGISEKSETLLDYLCTTNR